MASITRLDDVLGFQLFDLLPDAIIVVDSRGIVRYANRQAGQIFGREPRTLVWGQVEALLPEHLRERHIAHRAKYNAQPRMRPMGTGLNLVGRRADGTTFPVDITLNPLTHLAEPMVLAVVRDITNRRAAEEAQARLAAIVTSSEDAIIGMTPEGDVTSWNEAAARMFGYSAGEMIGQSIRHLMPADRQPEEDMFLSHVARGEGVSHYETVGLAKDGRTFDTSVTISPMRDAEGRVIGHSKIVRNISERKQVEQSLQGSKASLQFALDAARLGWWQYDPLHHVTLWDARLKEMFDVAEDKTDTGEFTKRVHPEDRERVWAAVEAALDPADPKPFATEFRHLRGDGEVRWVEAHGLTHFEGASPERRAIRMVGTAQDITKRKWREEERRERAEREHLLMREVNHRAKNMLSLVQAIARQSAAREPEDFVGRFTDRIQALSANQDLLIRNTWHGVETEDLVHAQLAPFADLIDSRIVARGPKLRLNAAAAQGIGLALHELATNAGKYGALSTDAGRVDIGWGTDGETFIMSWVERDGPPVSAPKQRGFGTIVLEAMTERNLDGRVKLDYALSGVTWQLTCPAANALEMAA